MTRSTIGSAGLLAVLAAMLPGALAAQSTAPASASPSTGMAAAGAAASSSSTQAAAAAVNQQAIVSLFTMQRPLPVVNPLGVPTQAVRPPRLTASERGTSYAPPLVNNDLTQHAPLATGQVSIAGDRAVQPFTATPPINPAEGDRQIAGNIAFIRRGERMGRRLGERNIELAAGQRLGGGTPTPSSEALIYDPRDLFDYRVKALENPSNSNGP